MKSLALEHLPVIASAPDGVKKLRELILQLAVMGKLVPQVPNDEPASMLLESLLKSGNTCAKTTERQYKSRVAESEFKQPFRLPNGWLWSELGAVVDAKTGYAFKSAEYVDEGTFVLRVTNIKEDGSICTVDSKYINSEAARTVYSKVSLKQGDVLLVMVGGSLGKIGVVSESCLPAVLNQNIWRIVNYGALTPEYLVYCLKYVNRFQLSITKSTHGHLVQGDYLSKVIPLPPLAEQHRIVAKVDELMALCDKLETQQNDSEAAHRLLVKTLLDTLTKSQDAGDFAASWARIKENFHTLFTTEESIDILKQTLLQLAVMGKLVPQDPNDEPASELLRTILKGRNEGPAKTTGSEIPNGLWDNCLPKGWCGFTLSQIAIIKGGGTPAMSNSSYWNGDIPWVSPKDMHGAQIVGSELMITKKALAETTVSLLPVGSVLLVGRSGILKRKLPVQIAAVPCAINQDLKGLIFPPQLPPTFMRLLLLGSEKVILREDVKQGTTVQSLVYEKLFSRKFGLPPLAEQHRIVAKVDELMALCETLKSNIQASRRLQKEVSSVLLQASVSRDTDFSTDSNRHPVLSKA